MQINSTKKNLKVIYLVSRLITSGPTRQLLNITSSLVSKGVKPYVVTLSPEPNDSLYPDFINQNIPVTSLNLSRWDVLKKQRFIWEKLAFISNADVLHTQGIRADYLASKYFNASWITTVRNIPEHDYPLTYGAFAGHALAHHHYKTLRNSRFAVGVSESVTRALSRKDLTAVTVRNGVDTSHFTPIKSTKRNSLKRDLGLPNDGSTIIVSTGHLNERKQPLCAFDICSAMEDAYIVFLGDGPLWRKLQDKEHHQSRKSAFLSGRVSDVRPWLRCADIFLSTSSAEGFPNSVLEALSCGVPVALSDIGPHREVVEHAPHAAVLLKTRDDATATAQKLQKFLEGAKNPRQEARLAAVSHFSLGKMADDYYKIYCSL